MARLPRIVMPGQPQHVIVRVDSRSEIFHADDDYGFYLERLKAACAKHGCRLRAYILMTNHVNLLITPESEKPRQGPANAGTLLRSALQLPLPAHRNAVGRPLQSHAD